MLGADAAYRHTIGVLNPSLPSALLEETLNGARGQLGETRFAEAWADGPQLFLEEAPEEFRRATTLKAAPIPRLTTGQPPPDAPAANGRRAGRGTGAPHWVDPLTPRELDVLRLVAQGLTNAQVAEELVVSPRTVHAHLRSVYGKLDVNSRTAATRYALEHDLLNDG